MILSMTRGDERILRGRLTDIQTKATVDLTGATIWFSVKRRFSEPGSFITKSTIPAIGGINVPFPPDGKFFVSFANIDTAGSGAPNARTTELVFDVQLKVANGPIQTVAKGKFIIEGEVTMLTSTT